MKKAPESDQVLKARKKLEEQIRIEKEMVTPEALREIQDKIYRWIERHSKERINLRERNVDLYGLFDSNQHPAKISSRFVQKLREEIAEEKTYESLKGRVKLVDEEAKQENPEEC